MLTPLAQAIHATNSPLGLPPSEDIAEQGRKNLRLGLRKGSKLFMLPLPPENSGCKAQRGGAGGAMVKRCNTANAAFRGQPEGLVSVFAHFYVARRSHAMLHHPITPRALNCTKAITSGGTNNFETASGYLDPCLGDGRPYLAGDAVTLGDCTLAAALQFARFRKTEIDPDFANIHRWDANHRQRQAAQDVLSL